MKPAFTLSSTLPSYIIDQLYLLEKYSDNNLKKEELQKLITKVAHFCNCVFVFIEYHSPSSSYVLQVKGQIDPRLMQYSFTFRFLSVIPESSRGFQNLYLETNEELLPAYSFLPLSQLKERKEDIKKFLNQSFETNT